MLCLTSLRIVSKRYRTIISPIYGQLIVKATLQFLYSSFKRMAMKVPIVFYSSFGHANRMAETAGKSDREDVNVELKRCSPSEALPGCRELEGAGLPERRVADSTKKLKSEHPVTA
jgi:hypothetical protein